MNQSRKALIWAAFAVAVAVPPLLAAASPLLQWRSFVYIVGGFAGVAALSVMLLQPLLVGGHLPGLPAQRGRRVHRITGAVLVAAVVIHVIALWITSPPDIIDALLFVAPTPFSVWGVLAMWALFAAAFLAAFRRRLSLRLRLWRLLHTSLVVVVVAGTVVHAMLIQGTMETISKATICALILVATVKVATDLRAWSGIRSPR